MVTYFKKLKTGYERSKIYEKTFISIAFSCQKKTNTILIYFPMLVIHNKYSPSTVLNIEASTYYCKRDKQKPRKQGNPQGFCSNLSNPFFCVPCIPPPRAAPSNASALKFRPCGISPCALSKTYAGQFPYM